MILRLESEKVDLMGEKSRLQGDMAMLKHEVELMQIATQGRSSSNGTSNGNGATGGVTTSNINSEMGRVQRDMAMELEMVRLKDLITEQALQIDKLMRQVEIKTKENASLVQSEAEGRKAMGMAMGDAESQMKTLELEKRGFLERIRLLEESTTEAIQEKKKAQGKLIHTSANLEALTAAHARLQHHYYRLQTNALRGGVVVPGLPVLHEKDLSPIPPASSSSPSSSSPSTTSSFSQQSHPSHNYEGNHMTSEEATFMLALSPLDQAKTRDEVPFHFPFFFHYSPILMLTVIHMVSLTICLLLFHPFPCSILHYFCFICLLCIISLYVLIIVFVSSPCFDFPIITSSLCF